MPQMYPLLWALLYVIVTFAFLFILCSLFFFFPIMDSQDVVSLGGNEMNKVDYSIIMCS